MRAQLLTALLLFSAASVWAQPQKAMTKNADVCACTGDIQERLRTRLRNARVLGTMAVPTSVVNCSAADPSGCVNEATVIFDKQEQKCVATLDYCVLCVASDKSSRPELTWNLVDKNHKPSTQFVFANNGIHIPNAGAGGKKHFVKPGKHPGKDTVYHWTAGSDKSAKLAHTTNIQPSGKGEGKCLPFDPVIVNNAN